MSLLNAHMVLISTDDFEEMGYGDIDEEATRNCI